MARDDRNVIEYLLQSQIYEKHEVFALNISDNSGALYIFLVGILLSIVAFISEIGWARYSEIRSIRNHPIPWTD